MDFPQRISLTITNVCNLKCRMCGQWSEEGYMHHRKDNLKQEMGLADWKRVVDELAVHQTSSVLLRGGEPFLFPGIIELLEYLYKKGIFISIDTNGTMLKRYAGDIVRIGNIHLTISVDGPKETHDNVRGVKGCFNRIKEGIALLNELEKTNNNTISKSISKSINFTISPYSISGLGDMPDVARNMSISTISIVPYYYVPENSGKTYEEDLKENLNDSAFSWCGFHHESSGVSFDEFQEQYRKYLANLKGIYNFPYMDFSEDEYRIWFADAVTSVGSSHCMNVEKLIDIQPQGDVNFCIDFPDYTIGNVKEATIQEIWNSDRARRFRDYRRKHLLAVCYRCGAKYMSEIEG